MTNHIEQQQLLVYGLKENNIAFTQNDNVITINEMRIVSIAHTFQIAIGNEKPKSYARANTLIKKVLEYVSTIEDEIVTEETTEEITECNSNVNHDMIKRLITCLDAIEMEYSFIDSIIQTEKHRITDCMTSLMILEISSNEFFISDNMNKILLEILK